MICPQCLQSNCSPPCKGVTVFEPSEDDPAQAGQNYHNQVALEAICDKLREIDFSSKEGAQDLMKMFREFCNNAFVAGAKWSLKCESLVGRKLSAIDKFQHLSDERGASIEAESLPHGLEQWLVFDVQHNVIATGPSFETAIEAACNQ